MHNRMGRCLGGDDAVDATALLPCRLHGACGIVGWYECDYGRAGSGDERLLGACLQRCQLRQPGRIGRRLKKTGDKKLERILRHSVQRTERRLYTLLAKADLGSVGLGKQHEARLAAKRLRYQAELYADWLDDDRLASHLPVCKALQETLGDLRDLALLAQHVGHDPASQLAQALAVARQQAATAAAQAWQAAHRHFRHA